MNALRSASDKKSHSAAASCNTSHPNWIICDCRIGKSTFSVENDTTSHTLNTACGAVCAIKPAASNSMTTARALAQTIVANFLSPNEAAHGIELKTVFVQHF